VSAEPDLSEGEWGTERAVPYQGEASWESFPIKKQAPESLSASGAWESILPDVYFSANRIFDRQWQVVPDLL